MINAPGEHTLISYCILRQVGVLLLEIIQKFYPTINHQQSNIFRWKLISWQTTSRPHHRSMFFYRERLNERRNQMVQRNKCCSYTDFFELPLQLNKMACFQWDQVKEIFLLQISLKLMNWMWSDRRQSICDFKKYYYYYITVYWHQSLFNAHVFINYLFMEFLQ